MSKYDSFMWTVFGLSALLYWWVGRAYVSRTVEEISRKSHAEMAVLGLALAVSRIGLGAFCILGFLGTGEGFLQVGVVVVFIGLMALGPHPLGDPPKSSRDRSLDPLSHVRRSRVKDEDGRGWACYDVETSGAGCLALLSGLGCLVMGCVSAGVLVILIWGEGGVAHETLRTVGWWTGLALLMALVVFGWGTRIVRIEVRGDALLVTRKVFGRLRFRTRRRFDEIQEVATGAREGAPCVLRVPGFLRSVRFGGGVPLPLQELLVHDLRAHVAGETPAHDGDPGWTKPFSPPPDPPRVTRTGIVGDPGATYEVQSNGHPGVMGCLSAMGCFASGISMAALVFALLFGKTRIPTSEIWTFPGWALLALVVALVVFGWAGRTVRIEARGDGFAVTWRVLRWLRFRSFRSFADIEDISVGPYMGVSPDFTHTPGQAYHCCTIRCRGWFRSVTLAHGKPADYQRALAKDLNRHLQPHRFHSE